MDLWEQNNGFLINEKGGMVSIDSYERTTMFILKRLLKLSHISNREQQRYNEKYLRECGIEFEDKLKKNCTKISFCVIANNVDIWCSRNRQDNIDKLYLSNDDTI